MSDVSTNISLFKEIFGELAKFSSKVETLLSQHEKQVIAALKNGSASSSISSGGMKKRKKETDPNAPHRPPSSYFIFHKKMREELKKENPNLSIGEMSKLVGKSCCSQDGV